MSLNGPTKRIEIQNPRMNKVWNFGKNHGSLFAADFVIENIGAT